MQKMEIKPIGRAEVEDKEILSAIDKIFDVLDELSIDDAASALVNVMIHFHFELITRSKNFGTKDFEDVMENIKNAVAFELERSKK